MRRHFLERMHLKLDLAVAGGGALGCSLLFWRGGREWFLLAFLSLCLLLLALIGAAWFVLPGLWWRTQPKLHGEYQLDFAPEGIDFRTEGIESRLQWSLFRRVIREPDFYLLYYSRWSAFTVIPTRAFASPADQERFCALLESAGLR